MIKKIAVVVCLLLLAIPCAIVLPPLWRQLKAEWDIAEETVLLDELDPDWRLVDLKHKRTPIPDHENGALLIVRLAHAVPNDWPIWNQWHDPGEAPDVDAEPEKLQAYCDQKAKYELAKPLHDLYFTNPPAELVPASKELLVAEVAKMADVILAAEEFVKYSKGRSSNDDDHDFLTCVRQLVTLLGWQIELDWQNKKPATLLRDAVLLMHIAQCISSESTSSVALRCGAWRQAIRALELSIRLGESDERQLEHLQNMLFEEEQGSKARYVEAFRWDRAHVHQYLLDLASGAKPFDKFLRGSMPDALVYEKLGIQGWRTHHALFLRETNDHIDKFKAGWNPEDTERGGFRWCASCIPQEKWYQLFAPEIQAHTWRYHCNVGSLRVAQFALACERYRLRHGGWPKHTNALIPEFLVQVPVDPLTKTNLKLERIADHWEVAPIGASVQQFWLYEPADRRMTDN